MSREALAGAANLHKTTIEHYETHSRKYSRPDTIRALADALRVTPERISEVVEATKPEKAAS
jgi:transcriptional regulator with XRE-family HTH domain